MQTRSAACIWLVSLLNFTQPSPALLARLEDVQEAFCTLLGDSDELIQEIASRGVSAVYRLCDESQQKTMMTRLVSSLSGKLLPSKAQIQSPPLHLHWIEHSRGRACADPQSETRVDLSFGISDLP